MITFINKNFNTLNVKNENIQDLYNHFIDHEVDFQNLQCSCHNHGCLTKHAYYMRTIKTRFGSFRLRIVRAKCSVCNHTHALLISCIVPYSQVLLKQHMKIITTPTSLLENLMIQYNIDEFQIRYIKRQYHRCWIMSLKDFKVRIDDSLAQYCFLYFKKQFMQIRNTTNIPIFMNG